jgi:hypothetical protein
VSPLSPPHSAGDWAAIVLMVFPEQPEPSVTASAIAPMVLTPVSFQRALEAVVWHGAFWLIGVGAVIALPLWLAAAWYMACAASSRLDPSKPLPGLARSATDR